jgi:hypothetical protein
VSKGYADPVAVATDSKPIPTTGLARADPGALDGGRKARSEMVNRLKTLPLISRLRAEPRRILADLGGMMVTT